MQQDSWYVAELVMEIMVESQPTKVVHRNFVLLRAGSPEEAYEKANRLGKSREDEYDNPSDMRVSVRFRGISKLDFMYEAPDDGAEVAFEEHIGPSEAEIEAWIPQKERLAVFRPAQSSGGPDYTSKEVLDEAKNGRVGRDSDGNVGRVAHVPQHPDRRGAPR